MSSATWLVRSSLAAWLQSEAVAAHETCGRLRVLDVGCGVKPYFPFFARIADEYVGVDIVDNPAAELRGGVEQLPVERASFDVVLCTQVLEHCDDPAPAVAELRRVTAPAGAFSRRRTAFRSITRPRTTTGAGRTRACSGSSPTTATWDTVDVDPAGGTAACLGMLVGDVRRDRLQERTCARARAGAGLGAEPRAARARPPGGVLREPVPGALFANLHVTAVVPTAR